MTLPEPQSARAIEEAASAWLVRRDAGLNRDEELALDAWIAEDVRNRLAWLRLKAAWDAAGRLAGIDPDSLAGQEAAEDMDRDPGPGLYARWKATAIRTRFAALAAALLLAFVGHAALLQVWGEPFETALGGRMVEPLGDGSRIELNTDSRIRVSVNMMRRHVWLDRGEAYFDVAADKALPFVIEAGGPRIAVVGTRFSVVRRDDGVTVRVIEGAVDVAAEDGEKVRALPGDQVNVIAGTLTKMSRGVETLEDEMAWRSGRLIFRDANLGAVAAEFNRYNRLKLHIADPEVAEMRVGGAFASSDAAAFAALLRESYDLRVRQQGDEIIVSR